MEGLGAEVSAKIRSAIKAKLVELDAYVDDELPDYIMVMVANKRTKVIVTVYYRYAYVIETPRALPGPWIMNSAGLKL